MREGWNWGLELHNSALGVRLQPQKNTRFCPLDVIVLLLSGSQVTTRYSVMFLFHAHGVCLWRPSAGYTGNLHRCTNWPACNVEGTLRTTDWTWNAQCTFVRCSPTIDDRRSVHSRVKGLQSTRPPVQEACYLYFISMASIYVRFFCGKTATRYALNRMRWRTIERCNISEELYRYGGPEKISSSRKKTKLLILLYLPICNTSQVNLILCLHITWPIFLQPFVETYRIITITTLHFGTLIALTDEHGYSA